MPIICPLQPCIRDCASVFNMSCFINDQRCLPPRERKRPNSNLNSNTQREQAFSIMFTVFWRILCILYSVIKNEFNSLIMKALTEQNVGSQ